MVCSEISNYIRKSNLHFIAQETPWSLYLTIRKKFINEAKCKNTVSSSEKELIKSEMENNELKKHLNALQLEHTNLEHENTCLKTECNSVKLELEQVRKIVKQKDLELNSSKSAVIKLNKESCETRNVNTTLKATIETMKKKMKLKEKEIYEQDKKSEKYESKISELQEFKESKEAEEGE